MSYAACNVANAKTYSSGCVVSSCNMGWSVSTDNSECVVNNCECLNGIAPSGEKCPSDGAKRCVTCDPGFKLDFYTRQEQELNSVFIRRLQPVKSSFFVKREEQPEHTPQEQKQQTTTKQKISRLVMHQVCAGTEIEFGGRLGF